VEKEMQLPGFLAGYFLQIKFANSPLEKSFFHGMTSERVKQNSNPLFCLAEWHIFICR